MGTYILISESKRVTKTTVKDRHWVGAYGLLVVRMCTFVEADLFRCGNTMEEPDDRGILAVWHTYSSTVPDDRGIFAVWHT